MAFRMRDHANGSRCGRRRRCARPAASAHAAAVRQSSSTPLRHWRSPRTGIDYPVEWRLRVGERELLHLQPLIDDQELDSRRSTGAIYWEGAVRVAKTAREIGRGYLEMTGYGEKLRVGSSIGMESQGADGRAIA